MTTEYHNYFVTGSGVHVYGETQETYTSDPVPPPPPPVDYDLALRHIRARDVGHTYQAAGLPVPSLVRHEIHLSRWLLDGAHGPVPRASGNS